MLAKLLFLSALIALLLVSPLQAQQEKYSKLRVYLDGRPTQDLFQLGITCDHGNHRRSVHFESDFSASDRRLLDDHQFRYDVLIDDVVAHYEAQNATAVLRNNNCGTGGNATAYPQPANFALGSMGGYLTYQQMLDNLDSMASKYPNLITTKTIIDPTTLTHQNRPIYWVKISDNPNVDESEPEALYNAIHHAREPMALSQLIYYMWYLLENYNSSAEVQYLLNNTELYFLPCLNPDGYIYNQTTNPNGGGMWRKNRRNNGDGTYGVDLNRNYGYAFAYDNVGSSGTTNSDTYRGTAAFSEPETQNMRTFCNAHNFIFSINYHTYGGDVVYPWAYNDQLTPDSNEYRAYGAILTRENNYVYGTNMETVGYSTNGDADDWLYGEQSTKNKILSLTPEATTVGFWPPAADIVSGCQETMWQNLAVAHLIVIFGEVQDQSPSLINQLSTQANFDITRYGMMNGNFTVSVTPISANIQSVGVPKVFTLNQFATASDSIAIQLNPSIQSGEVVRYVLNINNGYFTKGDTIERVYGNYATLFSDNNNSFTNWSNAATNSNWQTTTTTYYSPTACITDSKTGNYSNNKTSEIFLNQTINLSNATDANVEFWAKWNVEADYDFVQVMAAGSNGNYVPLCGLYTNAGTNNQDPNEPVFDGVQNTWVAEKMSLSDFVGQAVVNIKIRLVSDVWVNEDGFYFDDFKVTVLNPLSSGLNQISDNTFLGQNQPNPASLKVYIPLEIPAGMNEKLSLRITNVLGQNMLNKTISSDSKGVEVEIENWEDGVYFYQLVGDKYQSAVLKMVVAR